MSFRIIPLLYSTILSFSGGSADFSLISPPVMPQDGKTIPKAETAVVSESRVDFEIIPSRQIEKNNVFSLKQNLPWNQALQGIKARQGKAYKVASNFYIGMNYTRVIEQIGPPDAILTRNTVYRWGQGTNYFTIIYNEAGQLAGSGRIQLSQTNPLSETDKATFKQLVNRKASYAEIVQAWGEATTTLEEIEYGWLYEDNLFLQVVVLEEKLGAVYWAERDTTCFRCSIAY